MATRKKTPKKKQAAPRKPAPKQTRAKKQTQRAKQVKPRYDPDATQPVSVAEIIGDIEERQALDKLGP